ncbi:MAG: glycosyltransferase family 4 protein [Nitrospirae bacterium]|nr:glycosyltransferase family 4 protein [Nitrospirota bacterium]
MNNGGRGDICIVFPHEIRYRNKAHYKRISALAEDFDVSLVAKGEKYVAPEILARMAKVHVSPFIGGKKDDKLYSRSLGAAGIINHFLYLATLVRVIMSASFKGRAVVYTFPGPHIPFVWFAKLVFRRVVWVADIYDNPANLITDRYSVKWWLSKVNNFLQRAAYRHVDWAFISLAKGSLDEYGIPEDRVAYLTNGVDLKMFDPEKSEPRDGGRFELVFVGYILKELGMDTLVDAVGLLRERIPDVRLNLVGFISEKDRRWLDEAVGAKGLGDAVKFWGTIDSERVPYFLGRMDVCFIPFPPIKGKDETYPVKMFEFMAMGKAIVSTRLTGVSSVLDDGVDVLLVEPGNAGAMAEAVFRIYSDPELRKRLETNALAKSRAYDWRVINDKVVARLRELMHAPAKG